MRTQQKKLNFDQPLVKEETVEKEMLDLSSDIDPDPFSLEDALRELEDIREEVEETCAATDNVRAVPESAYKETVCLLEQLQHDLPLPDMMWSEDGGIGLEWRPGNGIATMSLYGDNLVIYGAFFNDKREVNGICSLSDDVLLEGFVGTLRDLI